MGDAQATRHATDVANGTLVVRDLGGTDDPTANQRYNDPGGVLVIDYIGVTTGVAFPVNINILAGPNQAGTVLIYYQVIHPTAAATRFVTFDAGMPMVDPGGVPYPYVELDYTGDSAFIGWHFRRFNG